MKLQNVLSMAELEVLQADLNCSDQPVSREIMKMILRGRDLTEGEWILIHDFVYSSMSSKFDSWADAAKQYDEVRTDETKEIRNRIWREMEPRRLLCHRLREIIAQERRIYQI